MKVSGHVPQFGCLATSPSKPEFVSKLVGIEEKSGTHHPERSWLNLSASLNMLSIEATAAVPHSLMSLLNRSAPRNMLDMFVELVVSKWLMSWSNVLALRNIAAMLVTLEVSIIDTSPLNKKASRNIWRVSVKFEVSILGLSLKRAVSDVSSKKMSLSKNRRPVRLSMFSISYHPRSVNLVANVPVPYVRKFPSGFRIWTVESVDTPPITKSPPPTNSSR